MAYMMKTPLIMPEIDINPLDLPDGTKGLFVKSDGIYVLNDDGSVKKIGFEDHSIYKFRGNYTSGLYLPKNPEIGAVYNIIEKSYITLEASCAYFTGKFSDYFSFVYEDSDGNKNYEFSNGDVWENYRDYFIDTSGSGTYGETYVYNIDGTYAGGFPYAQATGSRFVNNLTGYEGNDTDIVSFFICPTYVSSGLTVISVNAGENVAWTGTTWDSFGGLVDLSAYPTKTELNNALKDYYNKNIVDNLLALKADKQTADGGFQAGAATTVGNTGATEGGAIGKNAKETNGGFAGGAGANASYGGVIGKRAAEKNGGGAAGLDTYANAGGAVGSGAVAGSGFSGGKGAKAAPIDESKGTYIDAVQLGTGTNEVPGSLQVYEFQLMDGSGKIPVERLPETVTNSNWGGVVSSWAGLPSTPKLGMYCYVSADIISGVKYIGKVSDMFITETQTGGLYVSTFKFTPPDECINPNETTDTYIDIYDTNGIKVGSLVWNATMLPSFMDASVLGASSFDDTVTFYLGIYGENGYPSQIEQFYSGSMIFWNGTKWCGVASSDTVGEIETALDGILSIQNALIGGGSV